MRETWVWEEKNFNLRKNSFIVLFERLKILTYEAPISTYDELVAHIWFFYNPFIGWKLGKRLLNFSINYLDTAHVGLPSETAHTQCTACPQSLDDSDTGQWTVEDRERLP